MIADDMITFVRNDLIVFGIGVAVFLVIVLSLIFREARWVVLPLAGCFYAGLMMIGMLGLVGWKVTVISSNFLALMLIITISMNIHLTVRYRQLHRDFPSSRTATSSPPPCSAWCGRASTPRSPPSSASGRWCSAASSRSSTSGG